MTDRINLRSSDAKCSRHFPLSPLSLTPFSPVWKNQCWVCMSAFGAAELTSDTQPMAAARGPAAIIKRNKMEEAVCMDRTINGLLISSPGMNMHIRPARINPRLFMMVFAGVHDASWHIGELGVESRGITSPTPWHKWTRAARNCRRPPE